VEPDRPQHGRPVACVNVSQYSSSTFLSLRFHSRKEQFGVRLKNVISIFLIFKNCVCRGVSLYVSFLAGSPTGKQIRVQKKRQKSAYRFKIIVIVMNFQF
jgi:hypothetical protein